MHAKKLLLSCCYLRTRRMLYTEYCSVQQTLAGGRQSTLSICPQCVLCTAYNATSRWSVIRTSAKRNTTSYRRRGDANVSEVITYKGPHSMLDWPGDTTSVLVCDLFCPDTASVTGRPYTIRNAAITPIVENQLPRFPYCPAVRKPWPAGQNWPAAHFRAARVAVSTKKMCANFLDTQMHLNHCVNQLNCKLRFHIIVV